MARIETQQFVNDRDVIAQGMPKPRQWKVKAEVKQAILTPSKVATDPVKVELEVEATGAEEDIDRWVKEYDALHNARGLSRRQEAERLRQALDQARKTGKVPGKQ
jgi:hypothetical protein